MGDGVGRGREGRRRRNRGEAANLKTEILSE